MHPPIPHYPTSNQCDPSKPFTNFFLSESKQNISYNSAANRAPRPISPADAICTPMTDAADLAVLELAAAEAVLEPDPLVAEAALALPEPVALVEPDAADEAEPEAPNVDAPVAATATPPITCVVEDPTLTVK